MEKIHEIIATIQHIFHIVWIILIVLFVLGVIALLCFVAYKLYGPLKIYFQTTRIYREKTFASVFSKYHREHNDYEEWIVKIEYLVRGERWVTTYDSYDFYRSVRKNQDVFILVDIHVDKNDQILKVSVIDVQDHPF